MSYTIVFEGLGGSLCLVAGLLKLLALGGHAFHVLRRFHPRLQLFGVLQDLPLLVLQTLELPLQILALLLGAGLFQGRLHFFQPLVEIVLPLGQLL